MTGFRVIALAIAAILLSPHASSAQAWPSRPVTIVVPFPAGGTADLFAREIAQALSDELGQTFVVENRAGGGGNPAAAAVARMAPDGSTLLFASQAQAALNKFLYKRLAYDPARDLTPVVLVIKSPIALIAGIDAPAKSFEAMATMPRPIRASSVLDRRAWVRWGMSRSSSCSRKRASRSTRCLTKAARPW
jgi:tripartite-type tricarboxylate transporter receptor subunit TctC